MALICNEHQLDGHGSARTRFLYNCLDCTITAEVADVLSPMLAASPSTDRIYRFSMALQAPALAMGLRGVAVDPVARAEAEKALEADEVVAVAHLAEVAAPFWSEREPRKGKCAEDGKPHRWSNSIVEWRKKLKNADKEGSVMLEAPPEDGAATCIKCSLPKLIAKGINPHSSLQMQRLLYDNLQLPKQRNHKTHKISTDDECLDALKRKEPEYAEIIDAILAARKARKQLGLLRSRLDSDGRWRSSFNVGAAVTGRWSSSKSPRWTGGNLQNIADRSRNIFVADPGLVLFYADYSQAESRVIAYDAQDEAYIAAHETGDVHTDVTRLVWPHVHPWTGDLKEDRKLADLPPPFDPHHELRWYAKHIAHGSSIGMTPIGIARDAHVKKAVAEEAQAAFFSKFRRLRARQQEIIRQVQETGELTTPLGRRRQFFGRLHDPSTMREALAQTQQSMIVDWVSIALWLVWDELDTQLDLSCAPHPGQPSKVWLLGQIHDAILGEVRWGDDVTLARVVELMSFGMTIRGRYMTIPAEVKIGPNWRSSDMVKWSPGMSWPKW